MDLAGHRVRQPIAASAGPAPEPVPAAAAAVVSAPSEPSAVDAPSTLAAAEGTDDGLPLVAAVESSSLDFDPAMALTAAEAPPALAAAEASPRPIVPRVGRRGVRRSAMRRARHFAAGMLRRAEDWLRRSELEADRF